MTKDSGTWNSSNESDFVSLDLYFYVCYSSVHILVLVPSLANTSAGKSG